jgi:hypothetical protein
LRILDGYSLRCKRETPVSRINLPKVGIEWAALASKENEFRRHWPDWEMSIFSAAALAREDTNMPAKVNCAGGREVGSWQGQ